MRLHETVGPPWHDAVMPASAVAHRPLRLAEFFAGIGLMAEALEPLGVEVAWANDIERDKRDLYQANRPRVAERFHLGDVRLVSGTDLDRGIDLATASFPCIDLSLAGNRKGFGGSAERDVLGVCASSRGDG